MRIHPKKFRRPVDLGPQYRANLQIIAPEVRVIDENGENIPLVFHGKTRVERHEELIAHSIRAAISQARIAHDVSGGQGRIHMNVLWEMGGCERVLQGVLEGARGLVHGITCGAYRP